MRRVLTSLLLLGAILPVRALGQEPGDHGDKLAGIREQVIQLEAAGAFERALVLLRGVKEDSLDPVAKLERAQRIEAITGEQLEKYRLQQAKAAELEKAGKLLEAASALDGVSVYGSDAQVAESKAEQERLRGASEKAAADAKARAEEEAKKHAVDLVQDEKTALARVKKWLEARRQLFCSRCHGHKSVECPSCGGTGYIQTVAGGFQAHGRDTNGEPCPRCKTRKQIGCPDCSGSGHNSGSVMKVFWAPWPAAFQQRVDHRLGKKRFVDQLVTLSTPAVAGMVDPGSSLRRGPRPDDTVEACAKILGPVAEPILSYESVSVKFEEGGGAAVARYRVKVSMDERWEETRWKKDGASFALVPPDTEAEKPAPGSTPKGK